VSSSPLRLRLRSAHLDARRARDRRLAGALATVIAALENAEAVAAEGGASAMEDAPAVGTTDVARRRLDDATEHEIVAAETEDLRSAARGAAERGDEDEQGEIERVAGAVARLLAGGEGVD
jgi:hypothetical protein